MKICKFFLCIATAILLVSCGIDAGDTFKAAEYPVQVSSVKDIRGFVGDRMALNRDVYLKNFPIEQYVDFIVDRKHEDWWWGMAEQHGKWVESSLLSALQADDLELFDKVRTQLYRIIASQEDNGYLGATSKEYRSPERPIRGMDPYELYFVFHAFMTYYEQTGDMTVLESVEKLAGYFLDNFGPGKHEFWPSELRYPDNVGKELTGHSEFAGHSVHYGWEGTLLCDPMARLYELTGKQAYLDWSLWVVGNIDRWSGWNAFSKLDDVARGSLGVDGLQPYVHAHTFHMNFLGFLRLYRITGDESLLRKVKGAWDDIAGRQMYITGGVSVAEHYEEGFVKPLSGGVVETCATMSWMQLCQELLLITGDTKYADALEKIMVNHVFAAQEVESGHCRYHTPPEGVKPQGYFHGPDCCSASGHRIISMLPTFFFAKAPGKFFINQFVPCEYKGDDFAFAIEGNFPDDDNFEIVVTKGSGLALNIRIPGWCQSASVRLNGKPVDGVVSGSYLVLDRRWKRGDRIELFFPMEEKWVQRENHTVLKSHSLAGGEIMYEYDGEAVAPYAFVKGPVVYSVDMYWNGALQDDDMPLDKIMKYDISSVPQRIDTPDRRLLGPVFKAGAYVGDEKKDVILTPFCNIGWWVKDGEPAPDVQKPAYTYSIWLDGRL